LRKLLDQAKSLPGLGCKSVSHPRVALSVPHRGLVELDLRASTGNSKACSSRSRVVLGMVKDRNTQPPVQASSYDSHS
jgi:hypothetical protein